MTEVQLHTRLPKIRVKRGAPFGCWLAYCECCREFIFADFDWERSVRFAFTHANRRHSWTWFRGDSRD